MKTIKNCFLLLITVFYFYACESIENKAIIASNSMVNDFIYTNENIAKYFYRPYDDILYIFLDVYDNNGKLIQYSGDDFINKFIEIKNNYGKINNYEIIKTEYDYDIFPFYDYGYPHGVLIELRCYYNNNIITNETINGYYIKERNEINIVSYSIKNIKQK
jgi:hypothetical protein